MDIGQLAGATLGNYEIEKILGRGGMGMVYKARQVSLNRIVALKALYPELSRDASFVKRFRREALAVAQLDHKNIVQIYDIGEEDGIHFFSMEYVKGQSLKEILDGKGFLSPPAALKIMVQAASALAHAHKCNIIHRDIKPSNIMIDQVGRVKVMDFGLAKLVSDMSEITQTGALLGTPKYMSPEQCRGEELDARTDIYSLGVVFYEMLTGRMPFSAPDNMALMHKIIYEDPPDIKALNPEIPRQLCDIIARSMNKKKEKRYDSARAFLKAIRDFQSKYKEDTERLLQRERKQANRKTFFYAAGLLCLTTFLFFIGFVTLKRDSANPPTNETQAYHYDIQDYHPLSVGDQWVFRTSDGGILTQSVAGFDQICGKMAARMEHSDGLVVWAASDVAGWWQLKHQNPDGVATVFCTEEAVMDRKIAPGYHKSTRLQNAPVYDLKGVQIATMSGACSTVFDKVETITMANGVPLECMHLLVSLTQFVSVGGGMSDIYTFEVWMAKGIGPVRRIDNSGQVLNLESAVVDGKKYSFVERPASPDENASQRVGVSDPAGNLHGDASRRYLDILQAEAALREERYTLSIHTAEAFPEPGEMANRRIDIVFFADIDRDIRTGQSSLGYEYLISLNLDSNGWNVGWNKTSDRSRKDGIEISPKDFQMEVRGAQASISFPKHYLPADIFDWWAYCGTINAPDWPPLTENPGTAKSTFAAVTAK
ncbi:MAG: serine/threonine protein kinase [Candidatus Abyssobacteria bacterium SURF_5]|uniref:non-specific serine/threonine protein kinase n=1 Tax=Abyssobacteria bacterium (strain SURF_5) TaxID=2093360 RepID=A0A3A4NJ84_ABYX5|nr:MAG: serine/threonine protein kinase [Candidatus Abyssubacteria bacterium SURF_5]